MERWRKKLWSWWKIASSSSRLLWVMVSAVLVFLVFILWGAKCSNWVFASHCYHPWVWKWPSSSMLTSTYFPGDGSASSLSSNIVEDPMSWSVSPPKGRTGVSVDSFDQSQPSVDSFEGSQPPSTSMEVVGGGIISELEAPAPLLFPYNNIVNYSASSPLGIQVVETNQPGMQKKEILNITTNRTTAGFSTNETRTTMSTGIERRFSNLERLEARMRQARLAIRGATKGNQSYDLDYAPTGPMYWNADAFHRSYLEMEKQFKVYVYEEGEPPIFHNGPCKSIYAMEGNFIYQMEMTKFRTRDPDSAHIYFLPMSVTAIVHFIYESKLTDHWTPMKQTVWDYVNLLSGKYSYWNRSLGADHFMLACHDWGPELSSSVPELYKNSIRALCNANTSEGFNPRKDVSFPEIHLPRGTLEGLIGGPSPSQRPILVFFAGGLHGPIRPVLLEHWENKDRDIQVHRYLPKGVSYYGMMKKSKFCICPSGYEVASPRMVEALYTGCVPVLIKDHYVLPFSDVLNWKTFSVEIPVKDIPNLKKILTSISTRQYIRMHRRGKKIRRHFEVNSPPKRYDVFHMILHSVWLRRLNLQLHGIRDP